MYLIFHHLFAFSLCKARIFDVTRSNRNFHLFDFMENYCDCFDGKQTFDWFINERRGSIWNKSRYGLRSTKNQGKYFYKANMFNMLPKIIFLSSIQETFLWSCFPPSLYTIMATFKTDLSALQKKTTLMINCSINQ